MANAANSGTATSSGASGVPADAEGRAEHQGYLVSYRNRWWQRRWYAAGNVTETEAKESVDNLTRAGFKRVRMEAMR